MERTVPVFLVALSLLLAASSVSAEGSFLDPLLDFIAGIRSFIDSLLGGASQDEIVCDPPYLRSGDLCCLDLNANGICDGEESPTTTSTLVRPTSTLPYEAPSSSTTSSPSTPSSSTTSSSVPSITCSLSSDCGSIREERICYKGDVYIRKITPLCKNPGRYDSYCIDKVSFATGTIHNEPYPEEVCSAGCLDGECL